MSELKAIILAAGAGTRMKSKTPKVLHKVLGKTMVDYAIEAVMEAGANKVCVVIGHQAETVKASIKKDVEFVTQVEQLGTGHAVMQAEDFIASKGKVLVVFGDTPLISGETLKNMVCFHEEKGHAVTVLSTLVDDATGYGRIIRNEQGNFVKSVEHKDATEAERLVNEINSGMYCFEALALNEALKCIDNNNAQGEYYLPDTLTNIMKKGLSVGAMVSNKPEEILGVNTRVQLAEVTRLMQHRINTQHMLNGVTIINPDNTYISKDVQIGCDTIIHSNCIIEGETVIGEDNVIGPNAKIIDSNIGNGNVIDQSTVLQSKIANETKVGPFAYIRPNSDIGSYIKIGDFVEIKNATVGNSTKVSHLTYIGDADVGENVNFGCGTVVVNYDGEQKYRSTIKDNAFIGCNTNLVSPVTVESNAYTAAGSTITDNVPEFALAIARQRQKNIDEWVKKNRN